MSTADRTDYGRCKICGARLYEEYLMLRHFRDIVIPQLDEEYDPIGTVEGKTLDCYDNFNYCPKCAADIYIDSLTDR